MNLENKKQIAIIALAIGLGLVAAVLTGNYIQQRIQQETSLLANQFKKHDAALQQEMGMLQQQIKALESQQIAVLQKQQQEKQEEARGASGVSLAIRTPPGKRALSVNIDSLSAVGGLINPGDYVDILGHLAIPKSTSSTIKKTDEITAIVFQNIQVLAVGASLSPAGDYSQQQQARALTVTLAVDPEEAGLITFAQKNGSLQLVLRGQQETEKQMLQPASWEAFSEYVLNNSGMDLSVPRSGAILETIGGGLEPSSEEVKPYIQIFRGGREL